MSNNQCKLVPFTEFAKLRGNDKNYQDALEASSLFNKRLLKDRKMRIPFIDSQTRMAQSNTINWHRYQRRTPNELKNEASSNNDLAFVYSNKKWIKKRRLNIDPNDHTLFPYAHLYRSQTNQQDQNQNSTVTFTTNNNYLNENSNSMESITLQTQQQQQQLQQHSSLSSSLYQMLTKQSSQSNENENENDTQAYSQYHEDSYDNFDNDHDNSDEDDYEESKKKKKRGGKQKKKNDLLVNVDEKPYVCDKCGVKYKTKPGLSYHIQKTHSNTNNNNNNNNNSSNSINSMNLNSSSAPNMSNLHQKDIDENTNNSIFESGYEDTSSSLPHVSSYQAQSMYNHHS